MAALAVGSYVCAYVRMCPVQSCREQHSKAPRGARRNEAWQEIQTRHNKHQSLDKQSLN